MRASLGRRRYDFIAIRDGDLVIRPTIAFACRTTILSGWLGAILFQCLAVVFLALLYFVFALRMTGALCRLDRRCGRGRFAIVLEESRCVGKGLGTHFAGLGSDPDSCGAGNGGDWRKQDRRSLLDCCGDGRS